MKEVNGESGDEQSSKLNRCKSKSSKAVQLIHLHEYHGFLSSVISFKEGEPNQSDGGKTHLILSPRIRWSSQSLRNQLKRQIELPIFTETQDSTGLNSFLAERRKESKKCAISKYRDQKLQVELT